MRMTREIQLAVITVCRKVDFSLHRPHGLDLDRLTSRVKSNISANLERFVTFRF